MEKVTGYLRLMRPANVVTAVSDILAGMAISSYFITPFHDLSISPVLFLSVSTIGLYAGGVVFNDVFDRKLDQVERPERPIPSGTISVAEAGMAGIALLLVGIISAFCVNNISGLIAVCISTAALVYNKWSKHNALAGPINMGLCRGLNLLLGISVLPEMTLDLWYLTFIPFLYIAAITMISRGEVHGSNSGSLYAAAFLYLFVISLILVFAYNRYTLLLTLAFILPFAWIVFKPLLEAISEPSGSNTRKAVKAGVLSLILMNASWTASAGSLGVAVLILMMLPLSYGLSRVFAVT